MKLVIIWTILCCLLLGVKSQNPDQSKYSDRIYFEDDLIKIKGFHLKHEFNSDDPNLHLSNTNRPASDYQTWNNNHETKSIPLTKINVDTSKPYTNTFDRIVFRDDSDDDVTNSRLKVYPANYNHETSKNKLNDTGTTAVIIKQNNNFNQNLANVYPNALDLTTINNNLNQSLNNDKYLSNIQNQHLKQNAGKFYSNILNRTIAEHQTEQLIDNNSYEQEKNTNLDLSVFNNDAINTKPMNYDPSMLDLSVFKDNENPYPVTPINEQVGKFEGALDLSVFNDNFNRSQNANKYPPISQNFNNFKDNPENVYPNILDRYSLKYSHNQIPIKLEEYPNVKNTDSLKQNDFLDILDLSVFHDAQNKTESASKLPFNLDLSAFEDNLYQYPTKPNNEQVGTFDDTLDLSVFNDNFNKSLNDNKYPGIRQNFNNFKDNRENGYPNLLQRTTLKDSFKQDTINLPEYPTGKSFKQNNLSDNLDLSVFNHAENKNSTIRPAYNMLDLIVFRDK